MRPVAVLEAPAFFKGNTCQVAVAATVTLTEKDVPLMAAILSTLESNQQRTITDVFRGYQDLSAEELRLKAQHAFVKEQKHAAVTQSRRNCA